MGVCLRRFFPYGRPPVYDCLRLPAGSPQTGTELLAVLPAPIYPHPASVLYFHGSIQYLADAVGTDRRNNVVERPVADTVELPHVGGTLLVHVSSDQPLPFHAHHIPLARQGNGQRGAFLHRPVPPLYLYALPEPVVWATNDWLSEPLL